MNEYLTPEDIARELRVSRQTVKRLLWSGDLPTITIPRRGGFKYVIPIQAYFEWKRGYGKKKEAYKLLADLDFLKKEQVNWLEWCRSGKLTGKPMTESTIEKNNYALNAYWKRLPRRYHPTPVISAECLRNVFGSIDEKQFALKDNIYKAIRSFIKYLSINGYCSRDLISEISELKPRRVYPAKRSHCTLEQFELLLNESKKRCNGQSEYDMILNVATIATMGFAGLRVSELCNLRLQDVDLINRKLFVYLGKGKKSRYVGICKVLQGYLANYIRKRPKTKLENFFVTKSNNEKAVPFERHLVARRIKRLAKRLGIDISPHGLRRTFATIAANSGKPINIISLALGHSDLKTTQGYLMTSQDEVIKEMQGW